MPGPSNIIRQHHSSSVQLSWRPSLLGWRCSSVHPFRHRRQSGEKTSGKSDANADALLALLSLKSISNTAVEVEAQGNKLHCHTGLCPLSSGELLRVLSHLAHPGHIASSHYFMSHNSPSEPIYILWPYSAPFARFFFFFMLNLSTIR